jgi:hypothetical protein
MLIVKKKIKKNKYCIYSNKYKKKKKSLSTLKLLPGVRGCRVRRACTSFDYVDHYDKIIFPFY